MVTSRDVVSDSSRDKSPLTAPMHRVSSCIHVRSSEVFPVCEHAAQSAAWCGTSFFVQVGRLAGSADGCDDACLGSKQKNVVPDCVVIRVRGAQFGGLEKDCCVIAARCGVGRHMSRCQLTSESERLEAVILVIVIVVLIPIAHAITVGLTSA